MSFNAQAFLTGLAGGVAEGIKRKGVEAREFEKEEKRRAERNVATISQRQSRVQQVLGYTRLLQDQGASREQIQAIVSSGPEQIKKLANAVQAAVTARGGEKLGEADISTMIAMPDNFEAMLDMNTDEFVRRTFGTYTDPNAPQSQTEDISIWDRITGDAAMKRVNAELSDNNIYQNFSAQDINAMAAQQDYKAIVPSTFAMVSDYNFFGADQLSNATTSIARDLRALEENDAYRTVLAQVESKRKLTLHPLSGEVITGTKFYEEYQAQLAKKESMEQDHFRSYFDTLLGTYGSQVLQGKTNLKNYIEQYMGADYLNEAMQEYNRDDNGEIINDSVVDTGEVTGEVTGEGAGAVETGGGLVPDGVVTTEILKNTTWDANRTLRVNKIDGIVVGASVLGSDGEVVDELDPEFAKAAEEHLNSIGAGVVITAPPSLTDVSIDEMPVIQAKSITYEDWRELRNSADGRAKLKAAGLPESRIGGWLERFATEEGLAMIDFKKKADPNKTYMITIPGRNLNRPYQVSGSDLGYVPDKALVRDGSKPTIRELTEEEAAELAEDSRAFKTMSGYVLGKMYGTQGNTIMMPDETSNDQAETEAVVEEPEVVDTETEVTYENSPEVKEWSESTPNEDKVKVSRKFLKEHQKGVLEFLSEMDVAKTSTIKEVADMVMYYLQTKRRSSSGLEFDVKDVTLNINLLTAIRSLIKDN